MSDDKKVLRPEKVADVNELKEKIENSNILIVSDYRGLSANDMNEIRSTLTEAGAQSKIYKNTLAKIAFNEHSLSYGDYLLQGPSIIFSSDGDSAAVSKIVVKFSNDFEQLNLKGGFLKKAPLDVSGIKELSKLPPKDQLIGKSVALIKQPINSFVGQLGSPLRGLVYVLQAIKDKNQEVN